MLQKRVEEEGEEPTSPPITASAPAELAAAALALQV
jgi:hypothetical protein